MQKFLCLSLSVAILLSGCASRDTATKALPARLDSLFNSHFPEGEPGGAVLLAKGDSVIFSKGYGLADLKTQTPITTGTLFNLGSISKTFVANGILMLRQQGKLSLQDSLARYFPEFKNQSIASAVQIRHLLTHTSGLSDNREVGKDSIFYLTADDAANWRPITQADKLVFDPGSRFEYSNPAFNGLALIIERTSGQKWQDFIAERIFGPAGMQTSTITDGAHPQTGVAHGYTRIHDAWTEDDYGEEPTFCAAGNGGVWSSVDELFRYEKAIRASVFLDSATLRESREIKRFNNWSSSDPPFIGWSWFVEQSPLGMKTVGHTGTQGGFYCNYITFPDKQIFLVILANFPCKREEISATIVSWLENDHWLE